MEKSKETWILVSKISDYNMKLNSAKDLEVYPAQILFDKIYKKAYKLTMNIFQISKFFSTDEKYALMSQNPNSCHFESIDLVRNFIFFSILPRRS